MARHCRLCHCCGFQFARRDCGLGFFFVVDWRETAARVVAQEYSHYSALIRNTRVMTSYTESDAHVKWVTQQKSGLSERIKYMLDHGIGCDVTFKVHNNNRKCRVRYTSRDMTHPDSVLSLLCTIDERASQIRQYEAATGSIRDLCSLDCVCFS